MLAFQTSYLLDLVARCMVLLPVLWSKAAGKMSGSVKTGTASNSVIMNALADLIQHPTAPHISAKQSDHILERLRGIYIYLKLHPVLMERRLHVGSHPPKVSHFNPQKRNGPFHPGMAQPVCPYTTDWRLIYQAKDINESEVEVFQPTGADTTGRQWFYTVTCNTDILRQENPACTNCCRGVNSRRYASQCLPKKSYVMALVRNANDIPFDWNWIQVTTSCSCAMAPLSDT